MRPTARRTVPGPLWLALALAGALAACAECKKDFDCPGTKVCNTGEGRCEAFVCAEDQDCPPATRCRSNRCRSESPEPPVSEADAFVLGATVAGPVDAGLFNPPD
jgi:hypothetical protein